MGDQIVATISNHYALGSVILPYIVYKKPNQLFYTLKDRLTTSDLKTYDNSFSDKIKELIRITETYDENTIVKLFSKKKISSSDFFKNLDKDLLENRIRPYIEANLVKCIEIIKECDIDLFYKEQVHNIHEEDRIELIKTKAETVFHFIKDTEGTRYYLSIKNGNNSVKLTDKSGLILSNKPCRLILDNKLYLFDDIDGKKLLPFFSKDSVIVQKSAEEKYFETFVKNSIRDYSVIPEGFTVEYFSNKPEPIIELENDLNGIPSLVLKFKYEHDQVFLSKKITKPVVLFGKHNNNYHFSKINRDYEFENEKHVVLTGLGLKNRESNYYLQKDNYDRYDLVCWISENESLLKKGNFGIIQTYYEQNYNISSINLEMHIDENNDWFDVHAVVKIGKFKIPFVKLRKHILNYKREYELPDGSIFVLPEEWFSQYRDLFVFGKGNEKSIKIKNYHYHIFEDRIELPDNSIAERINKLNLNSGLEKYNLPENIHALLRPYQVEGFRYMLHTGESNIGVCLADDMGLGKTLQTLTLLQYKAEKKENIITKAINNGQSQQLNLFENNDVTTIKERQASVIIMPASLIHNWYNEVNKFSPSLKVLIYTGNNRHKDIKTFGEYDIILSTYGTVRIDYNILKEYNFFYIILDESQVIKNFHSKTYKAVVELQSRYKLVLTGTPIENSLSDLWAQLNFLNRGLLGNFSFFKNEFLTPIERNKDEEKKIKLQKIIQPFILRRTKKEVANDLPELTEQIIYCDLTEEQEKIYEEEKSKIRNNILKNIDSNGIEKSAFVVLQGLTRLRQLANHPLLVADNYEYDSGKFEEVTRNIENVMIENHKALVFSSFVKHLNLFEKYIIERGYKYSKLTGETTNREEVVNSFQKDPENKIFLISLKAGGVGLNLTAAEYVFMLDPWWNPAAENQAINRAHRIGQENKVFVYRFISGNTIEEKILRLQERKSKLADVFVNSNNPFKELSINSIMELFD